MKYGTNKLRIVLICNFMNQEIQEKLKLGGDEKELAPWISLLIKEVKKRDDIELYVISPFYKILKNYFFSDNNIHYHCIKVRITSLEVKLNFWVNYYLFNLQVRKLVKKINPDLVNLYGAENAYYSSSILHIKGYPILVTIQGFISLDNENNIKDPRIRKRVEIEAQILRTQKFFGIEAAFMEKYIRTFNPNAKMFWFHCFFSGKDFVINVPKEYDIVYFARVTKMKGVEDLIKAVSIARIEKPDIKLCIMGRTSNEYMNYLRNLAENEEVTDNIIFKGFIPSQKEMHLEVTKGRISVLPTYNDTIPGTIVESMLLSVPVIAYDTGGIPDLNKDGENVILVEQGNIEKLAQEIVDLLGNIGKQKELAERAMKYAEMEFDNANSVNKMIEAYKEVIEDYKKSNL